MGQRVGGVPAMIRPRRRMAVADEKEPGRGHACHPSGGRSRGRRLLPADTRVKKRSHSVVHGSLPATVRSMSPSRKWVLPSSSSSWSWASPRSCCGRAPARATETYSALVERVTNEPGLGAGGRRSPRTGRGSRRSSSTGRPSRRATRATRRRSSSRTCSSRTRSSFDSKGTGASSWGFLLYLLPFVLIIALFIFIARPKPGWWFEGDEFWEVACEADVAGFAEGDVSGCGWGG